jgi:hypothetical protein
MHDSKILTRLVPIQGFLHGGMHLPKVVPLSLTYSHPLACGNNQRHHAAESEGKGGATGYRH